MNRIVSRMGVVAGAALSLSITGLAGAAHAEGFKLPRMDTSSPQGVQAFKAKVDTLAGQFCRNEAPQTGTRILRTAECRQAVWDEVMEQLSTEQKTALRTDGKTRVASSVAADMTATAR